MFRLISILFEVLYGLRFQLFRVVTDRLNLFFDLDFELVRVVSGFFDSFLLSRVSSCFKFFRVNSRIVFRIGSKRFLGPFSNCFGLFVSQCFELFRIIFLVLLQAVSKCSDSVFFVLCFNVFQASRALVHGFEVWWRSWWAIRRPVSCTCEFYCSFIVFF